jgi:hypothetical protein
MSDTDLATRDLKELVNTLYVSRKISGPKGAIGQYENMEVGLHVQFVGDAVGDAAGFEAGARFAATEALGVVFQTLGLSFTADSEGVLREVATRTFGGAVEPAVKSQESPPTRPPTSAAGGAEVDLGEGILIKTGQYGAYYTDGVTRASVPFKSPDDQIWLQSPRERVNGKMPPAQIGDLRPEAKTLEMARACLAAKAAK